MTRTFGIEIEAFNATREAVAAALQVEGLIVRPACYSAVDANSWLVKTDASIQGVDGFELVSPPLTDLADVAKACRALNAVNAKVNKSTGLHVHCGAADLKIADWKNMVKRYRNNEVAIDSVMPRSRRENNARYVQSILNLTDDLIDRATTIRQLGDLMRTRYLKLNVQSFIKHGTVEFRQHSGTVEFSKISKWVEFCLNFVESSKVKTKTSRIKPEMVIEFVGYNRRDYGTAAWEVSNQYVEGETVANFMARVSALNLNDSKRGARVLRDDLEKGFVKLAGFSAEATGANRDLWAGQTPDTVLFYADRAQELN